MVDPFVNRLLNEGEPNDFQSSGQSQAAASFGVLLVIGLFFVACAGWAAIHGFGDDGNGRSWIGFALALAAAIASILGAARRRRR
jgi:hypothetical protein